MTLSSGVGQHSELPLESGIGPGTARLIRMFIASRYEYIVCTYVPTRYCGPDDLPFVEIISPEAWFMFCIISRFGIRICYLINPFIGTGRQTCHAIHDMSLVYVLS